MIGFVVLAKSELAKKKLKYNLFLENYNSDTVGGIQKTILQYGILTKQLVNKNAALKISGALINLKKKYQKKIV
jgi:hypothetical protein